MLMIAVLMNMLIALWRGRVVIIIILIAFILQANLDSSELKGPTFFLDYRSFCLFSLRCFPTREGF